MDRDIVQRLIDLYNEHYAKIFMAAQRKGRDAVLRRDISAFFRGSASFAEPFRELAFGDDGKLPPEGILRNLDAIRASQKLEILFRGLSELLDLMLFSAMEAVERHDEQELERRTQAILAEAARPEGGGAGNVVDLPARRPASGAPVDVVDLLDSMMPLVPPMRPEEVIGYLKIPPRDSGEPMGERALATFVPYLPDAQANEFASGLRACRSDATLALERAEQIAAHAGSGGLREIALRCCEHAAAVIRALDELEQRVARLRRR